MKSQPRNPPEPSPAPDRQSSDPLHGVTLQKMVERLVEHLGWEELGYRIRARCFQIDPSIKSSLTFLRKTPWAREKVEALYLQTFHRRAGARSKPPGSK